jgi:hypothetical protein
MANLRKCTELLTLAVSFLTDMLAQLLPGAVDPAGQRVSAPIREGGEFPLGETLSPAGITV